MCTSFWEKSQNDDLISWQPLHRPELKSDEFLVVTAIGIEIISILVEIGDRAEIRGTLIGILSHDIAQLPYGYL